jgi:hypothetical protein
MAGAELPYASPPWRGRPMMMVRTFLWRASCISIFATSEPCTRIGRPP